MKTILAVLSLFGSVAFAADVTDVKIRALDGFGGDTSSVASRCQTAVGKPYDPITVTRDVEALKNSGEFEDISADAQRNAAGVEVTFLVKRKMRFAGPLVVQGNEAFSESKVAKEADLKDGYLYGDADFAAAAAKVRLAYQKKDFPDAKVIYKTDVISGNDVTVTFIVDEGREQAVGKYVFEGADHAVDVSVWRKISPYAELDADLIDVAELHDAVEDFPWWNPIGWFTDRLVTKDQQAQCCEKLAAVYRNHGYLDVQVTGPERVPTDDGKANIVFKVLEGPQYKIGTSSIKGLTRYPEDAVKEKSNLPGPGVIAAENILDDAAHRIEVTIGSGDSGLADTRVAIKRIPTDDPSTVNIVYQVSEGVPVVINEVQIRGNDYTKDKVIRREIALGPGDRMLADRAERSQRRLENLDYFSRVRYYLEPADKGKAADGAEYRNLVYEVEEKNTGSFMVGVGASTVDSVYISAEVNQNNFDLFAPSKLFRGAGQKGRVYVAWGPRYQSAEIGFVEPHLFNRLLELSVDIYRRLRWYDEYDLIRTGAQAALTYPVKFWPTWEAFGRLGIGLSGEYIEFDEVDDGWYAYGNKTGQLYKDEEREYGDAFEPVVHLFWLKDSRDNFRIPTRGHRTKLYADVAPACDNQYWRLGLNHRSYFNAWKRFNHVFMVGLRAETIDAFSDEVPIYNRMFLGGPRSIRGIRYRYVAPMAQRADGRDSYTPWGGQTLFCMNFEYTIPIVKMFRFALFSDLGSVGEDTFDLDFSDTFAWTGGVGLRLDLPMFPIRLDFAVPFTEPEHAEKEVFSFLVGYDF
ncbi:MAG: outer membrane protein assembly factor BamA [Kiritimatiellae bacterium]|nr:outer membrane protein assembly factor BamA [Kiritimatiellia bacterium]